MLDITPRVSFQYLAQIQIKIQEAGIRYLNWKIQKFSKQMLMRSGEVQHKCNIPSPFIFLAVNPERNAASIAESNL